MSEPGEHGPGPAGAGTSRSHARGADDVEMDVRGAIARSALPGNYPELSDAAAILIASGFLADAPRRTLIRRISEGHALPSIGGFGRLRLIQTELQQIENLLARQNMPGFAAFPLRARAAALRRRRSDAAKEVNRGRYFASGVRGVRRERREGVYLDIADRARLFDGLLFTPTPAGGGPWRRVGATTARFAGSLTKYFDADERWSRAVQGSAAGSTHFPDSYETLLFLAGHCYDEIINSPAWQSDNFAVQRNQIDLAAELSAIATDTIALRAVRIDLSAAKARNSESSAIYQQVESREATLRPVWAQLVDRVAGLAGILAMVRTAEADLRAINQMHYTATLDHRIEELVGRGGERELAADNTAFLARQVREANMELQAYRTIVEGGPFRELE